MCSGHRRVKRIKACQTAPFRSPPKPTLGVSPPDTPHTSASAQDIKYQGAGVIFSSGSNVTVQLKDNDVSAVTLSALNVFSRENGVNGTYSISLETHPSASRSELFMSNLDADVVITEQQVVTVVAVSDDAPEDLSNYIITHTASSEDPKYNSTARSSGQRTTWE